MQVKFHGNVCPRQWQTILINTIYIGNQVTESIPTNLQAKVTRKLAIKALEALKAENILLLDVREQASFTDYMILASGSSTRHVSAIADSVIEAARAANEPAIGIEGEDVGEWVLVDLGDVIVHIMLPDVRLYYELEKLWGEELVGG
jgi:ribosome-associated protein